RCALTIIFYQPDGADFECKGFILYSDPEAGPAFPQRQSNRRLRPVQVPGRNRYGHIIIGQDLLVRGDGGPLSCAWTHSLTSLPSPSRRGILAGKGGEIVTDELFGRMIQDEINEIILENSGS